jgi:hypothetical protein
MEQIAPLPPTQAPTPASLGSQVTPASHVKRRMGGVTVTRSMLRSGDEEGVQKLQELGSQRHMQLGTSVWLASREPCLCRAITRSVFAGEAMTCGPAGEEDHRPKRPAESKAAETRGHDPPAIQSEISGPPETNVGKGG